MLLQKEWPSCDGGLGGQGREAIEAGYCKSLPVGGGGRGGGGTTRRVLPM